MPIMRTEGEMSRAEKREKWWALFSVFGIAFVVFGGLLGITAAQGSWTAAIVFITLTSVSGLTVIALLGCGLMDWVDEWDHVQEVVSCRATQSNTFRDEITELHRHVENLQKIVDDSLGSGK